MGGRCIPVEDGRAWDAALDGVPHAFAHSSANCRLTAIATGHTTYLYVFDEDDVRILCPLAERQHEGYTDIYTPYGFSGFVGTGAHPSFGDTWRTFVDSREYICGYFGLNPAIDQNAYHAAAEIVTYGSAHVLDLTQSVERLYAAMDANRRRQVTKSEAQQGQFIHDRGQLRDFFIAAAPEFYRARHGSPGVPFTREFVEQLFSLNETVIVGAGTDGIEAVTVFAYTRWIGEFLFNVSVGDGRRHSTALLWYGLLRLRDAGVPRLNLGGGIRADDGVAGFKQRFGGRPHPLTSARQIYRRALFEQLCRERGADPDSRDGYFPPYRRGTPGFDDSARP